MEIQAGLNSLNGFDYTVIAIMLLCGFLALVRGFVREVLALVSLAAAFFVAAHFYPLAEPFMQRHLGNHKIAAAASGVAMFFGSWLLLTIISSVLARYLVRGRALNIIDRSLGFGFGLLRGAFVLCIVYMAAMAVLWPDYEKEQALPAIETAQTPTVEGEYKQASKDKDLPPAWILKAKTRPALTYGAHMLKSFIPQGAIEKTLAQYLDEKKKAQHALDDHMLDMLSTPAPTASKTADTPTYDDKSRDGLNHLVDQKANP